MVDPSAEVDVAPDLDEPVWGVENFTKIIKRNERQTFHLIYAGKLPSVRKVGGRYVSTRRKLLCDILGDAA